MENQGHTDFPEPAELTTEPGTHGFSRATGEDRRVCVVTDVNWEVLAVCGAAEVRFGRFWSA
jgi:hypothetical protein